MTKARSSVVIAAICSLFLVVVCSPSHAQHTTCPNELTRSDSLGPFFIPNVPERDRLAPENELADPANMLTVEGTIYGNDCVPLSDNIKVEVWYAGDPAVGNSGYSFGGDLRYRGTVTADVCGSYSFLQSFPRSYPGRRILHLHFRISTSNTDETLLVTQMYFEGFDTDNLVGRDLQIVPITTNNDESRAVMFDIFLNVPGTADVDTCGRLPPAPVVEPTTTPVAGAGDAGASPQTSSAGVAAVACSVGLVTAATVLPFLLA